MKSGKFGGLNVNTIKIIITITMAITDIIATHMFGLEYLR
jgi:hypothetical protein